MIPVPSIFESEKYRFHTLLYDVLDKIEHIYFGKNIPQVVEDELFLIHDAFNKILKDKIETSDYRVTKLAKLKHKIDTFRQKYFTQVDWENLRVEWYFKNGLVDKLRENDLDLKTRCELVLEPPEIIAELNRRLNGQEFAPSSNVEEMIELFRENKYHINIEIKFNNSNEIYHFEAVYHNHFHIAKKIFDKQKRKDFLEMCVEYLCIKDMLPDYMLEYMGKSPSTPFTLEKLIEEYPDDRVKILKKSFKMLYQIV